MSTKLTKAGGKLEGTESPDERKEPMSGSCQPPEANAPQKQADGKQNTSVMTSQKVMTVEEISDLLGRLQDILSLWSGSDNRIIGNFVMTVLPVPAVMTVDKVENASHDKVFCVNGKPVTSLNGS